MKGFFETQNFAWCVAVFTEKAIIVFCFLQVVFNCLMVRPRVAVPWFLLMIFIGNAIAYKRMAEECLDALEEIDS